jgi:hydrogenase expression/formation protein HypE
MTRNGATVHAGWAEEAVATHAGAEHLRTEEQVLERIERARRRRPRVREERITLAHGAGGKATHTLIEAVFVEAFRNPVLEQLEDGASLQVDGARLAFTTDSYVVSPLFFPGGDIGDLAVNGTVNDLAMCGARPLYLSAGFILEEGFPVADLRRIAGSMARAAATAGVQIVTGDTKVVPRGAADGCFVNTAGVGLLERPVTLSATAARPGDAVIVSGPLGDHGITIMLARGELDIDADVRSDTQSLWPLVAAVRDACGAALHCMRDATRGGVATVLNEIALATRLGVVIDEQRLPLRPQVVGASEILGIDPLYVANEGKLVAFVDPAHADAALAAMRAQPAGESAAIIGEVRDEPEGRVLGRTTFGGHRMIDMLVGDPLPRIC